MIDCCFYLITGDPGVPSCHRPLFGWAGLCPRSPSHPLLLRRSAPLSIPFLRYTKQYTHSFTVMEIVFLWLWWYFKIKKKQIMLACKSVFLCHLPVHLHVLMPWLNLQLIVFTNMICVTSQSVWVVNVCVNTVNQDSRQVDVSSLRLNNKNRTVNMCCTSYAWPYVTTPHTHFLIWKCFRCFLSRTSLFWLLEVKWFWEWL